MLNVREVQDKDIIDIAQISIDVWRTTYKGLIPDSYLNNLSLDKRKRLATDVLEDNEMNRFMYVLENGSGKVIGFARANIETNQEGENIGELGAIYILKDYQRRGLGKLLVKNVFKKFLNLKIDRVKVWVLEGNPSIGFYEAMGAVLSNQRLAKLGTVDIIEKEYLWHNINLIINS